MKDITEPLPAPSGLQPRGTEFWRSIADEFELSDSEAQLLREACKTLDTLDDLAEAVERDGVTVLGSTGQTVVHPAVTEARQQRLVLHRLVAALQLPDDAAIPTGETLRAIAGGRATAAKTRIR